MAERLFGLETEFALAMPHGPGHRRSPQLAAEWLMAVARQELRHLPDTSSAGMFLGNGARFYVDCGGHPEFTTPECANPWDAARYLKAGERILQGLARSLARSHPDVGEICLGRQNVDYSGSGSTWGSHESYLHRAEPGLFRSHLVPHLVSRVIYTGAGGFDSLHPGIRFLLSPRVPHLDAVVSSNSTHSRGILHTKNEPLSGRGYQRLHLLCSESLFSERAIFLRIGATALVVALIEGGLRPGESLGLVSPLDSMRAFAADPACRATALMLDGRALTAAAIQRHYLALAEAHLQAPFMPPWAGEVCRQWRCALDRVEAGSPDTVATELDWAIRHSVFTRFIRQRGYTWEWIERTNALAESTARASADGSTRVPALPEPSGLSLSRASERADPVGLRADLRAFREFLALRAELFELDTRFGQLGAKGVFDQLDRAGVLHHHVDGVDNFEHAMESPPLLGRARIRGECVQRLGCKGGVSAFVCDWASVWERERRRVLDLADPWTREEAWKIVSESVSQ